MRRTLGAVSGGGVPMQYETVDPSKCSKLIRTDGGKLLKRQIRDEFWAGSGRAI